jgi:hypothetical protein
MMSPEKFIADWMQAFQHDMIRGFDESIQKAKLSNTDELRQSLRSKAHTDEARGIFFMVVYFKTYGRLQDMRRHYDGKAGGEEMVQALWEWAQKRGVDKFVKGKYNDMFEGVAASRILNAIAWGTIKKYNQKSPRKRSWYNKTKSRMIEKGYVQLLEGYKVHVLRDYADAFSPVTT